jgi:hypothetical protein
MKGCSPRSLAPYFPNVALSGSNPFAINTHLQRCNGAPFEVFSRRWRSFSRSESLFAVVLATTGFHPGSWGANQKLNCNIASRDGDLNRDAQTPVIDRTTFKCRISRILRLMACIRAGNSFRSQCWIEGAILSSRKGHAPAWSDKGAQNLHR